jgi:hypothetical protein
MVWSSVGRLCGRQVWHRPECKKDRSSAAGKEDISSWVTSTRFSRRDRSRKDPPALSAKRLAPSKPKISNCSLTARIVGPLPSEGLSRLFRFGCAELAARHAVGAGFPRRIGYIRRSYPLVIHAARWSDYAELAILVDRTYAESATEGRVFHAESAADSYKSLIILPYRAQM